MSSLAQLSQTKTHVLPGHELIRIAVVILLVSFSSTLRAQAPKPLPDTLVFINGEQLTGTLEHADSAGITFLSPMAGEITVKWPNIKQLHTATSFAVIPKNAQVKQIPQGTLDASASAIQVQTPTGSVPVPTAQLDTLVDLPTFTRTVEHPPNLAQGWAGTITGGISLVRATQNSTTYTGMVSLVRVVPLVSWSPPRSRTLVNFNQSYGTVTQPGLDSIKSNVFHANTERDRYISPRLYLFVGGTFDHNFAQSLQLQQSYGTGVGITFFTQPRQQLDLRADIHYETQAFTDATQNQRIAGSTFYETYFRHLPHGVQFNEVGSLSPAWTNANDYSAHVAGNLIFPVYKGFGFNLGAVDDYLNNAPFGSNKNSSQFTTGLTYTVKPR